MKQSDLNEFATAITALAATHRVEADPAMIEGYWMGMEDLPIDVVLSACKEALRTLSFFPKPVELRKLAGVRTSDENAALAWADVSEAAKRSALPDDPVAAEVVRHMGGPKRLGMMPAAEFETWGRKEFERIYVAVAETNDVRKRLGVPSSTQALSGDAADIAHALAAKKGMP